MTVNTTQQVLTASAALTSTTICPGDLQTRETPTPANVRPHLFPSAARSWRPLLVGMSTHSCVLSSGCECNNHAQRCHFDQAVYEASGRRSGGVCEECMHHTTGPKCDQCAPGYQPNPRSRMDRPDACIRKHLTTEIQKLYIFTEVRFVMMIFCCVAVRLRLQHRGDRERGPL